MTRRISKYWIAWLITMLASSSISADEIPFWNPVINTKKIHCSDLKASFKLQKTLFGKPVLTWNKSQKGWEKFVWQPMAGGELVKSKCDASESGARCEIISTYKGEIIRLSQTINFDLGKFVVKEERFSERTFDCY